MQFSLFPESEKFQMYYQAETRKKLENRGTAPLRLILGRNDRAALQAVLVHTEDEYCVCVSESAYFCVEGNYDIFRVSVQTEGGVQVACNIEGFADCENGRHYNDILESAPHKFVSDRHRISVFWIELFAPEGAAAGQYCGEVKLFCRRGLQPETEAACAKFEYSIMDAVVPPPSRWSFFLDLWQHTANIARKCEVERYSERHFELLRPYIRSLAELGQKSVTVIASDAPWGNAFVFNERENLSDLYEYSMIDVCMDKDGNMGVDFTKMQRYIDLCAEYGIKQEIEVFGLLNILACEDEGFENVIEDYSDTLRVRCFDEKIGGFRYLNSREEIIRYLRALYGYFIETEQIERVRIASDEPDHYTVFAERLQFFEQNFPRFRFKISLFNLDIIRELYRKGIDIAVGLQTIPYIDTAQPRGGKFLFYVCCGPSFPNTFVRSELLETRFIPILARAVGADGFLRWNYTIWPDRPREQLTYKPYILPSGDTNFVYPSASGAPLLSVRYKMLQRGIADSELYANAKKEAREKAFARIRYSQPLEEFFREGATRKDGMYFSVNYNDYCEMKKILLENQK